MKNCILLFSLVLFSCPLLAADYAEKAHEAFKQKDYALAGEFYEKAYENNKTDVYLDNAVSSYLSHAFNLSTDEEYESAIKYCEKILALKPDNNTARELLCEIYYSRGSDYYFSGNIQQAVLDMENSLKYSVLPEQSQRAKQELAQIMGRE